MSEDADRRMSADVLETAGQTPGYVQAQGRVESQDEKAIAAREPRRREQDPPV
jgi:hypothetical protein